MERTEFTTITRGLDRDLYPYRLWQKAKALGTWDPAAIDYDQDRRDWGGLSEGEHAALLGHSVGFLGGEESVVRDLMPFMLYISREQRMEEEMYLASFLWEEAKHIDAFYSYLSDVAGQAPEQAPPDLLIENAAYQTFYGEVVPSTLNRLLDDPSPEALADASVAYHMVSEGILAETGYYIYYQILEQRGIMPGLQQMIRLVQRDEARHIGYGVYLLSRLVAVHGEPMWRLIEERMNGYVKLANRVFTESILGFNASGLQLDLDPFKLVNYSYGQFLKRRNRIEKARRQSLQAICYGTDNEGAEEG